MILVTENHCLDNMNRNKTLLLSELAANKYSILVLSVVQISPVCCAKRRFF